MGKLFGKEAFKMQFNVPKYVLSVDENVKTGGEVLISYVGKEELKSSTVVSALVLVEVRV